MHHKTKEKYLKAIKDGLTEEELRKALLADGIAAEEAEAFITENFENDSPEDDSDPAGQESGQVGAGTSPKAADKPAFDYNALKGKEFERFNEHLASLPLNKLADFHVYKVEPIVTEKYPGLKGTPRELTGIRTIDRPIQKTRISPKIAMNLNSQVRNTGRYYLLAQ